MELNDEQENALKELIDNKIKTDKQKEENKVVNDGKQIEWYAALVNANFETRFELDRQLLTISSAAIGVLIAFVKEIESIWLNALWILSGSFFLATILFALNIFKNNRKLLEGIIQGKDTGLLDESLDNKDYLMKICFIMGVIFLFVIALFQLTIFK